MPTPIFLTSAAAPGDFPADAGHEVAFVGRSNSGKSTAINAIVGVRKLARVSKTPGRTQLINFFEVGPERRLVDLPGYGFARVPTGFASAGAALLEVSPRASVARRRCWSRWISAAALRARRPSCSHGSQRAELPVGLLLTKADKLSRSAGLAQERALVGEIGANVTRFSALTHAGVAEERGSGSTSGSRWAARI